jgi:phosphoenolpyruvate carboxykinase (ATP)
MPAAAGRFERRICVKETGVRNGAHGADKFGFKDIAAVHWNLDAPQLYEHSIAAREATVVQGGPICAETGVHTGRSPKDKHTVCDALTEKSMWWEGNRKITPEQFQLLYDDFIEHARGKAPRTSTAVPIRTTGSRHACSPSLPGIRCSSVSF